MTNLNGTWIAVPDGGSTSMVLGMSLTLTETDDALSGTGEAAIAFSTPGSWASLDISGRVSGSSVEIDTNFGTGQARLTGTITDDNTWTFSGDIPVLGQGSWTAHRTNVTIEENITGEWAGGFGTNYSLSFNAWQDGTTVFGIGKMVSSLGTMPVIVSGSFDHPNFELEVGTVNQSFFSVSYTGSMTDDNDLSGSLAAPIDSGPFTVVRQGTGQIDTGVDWLDLHSNHAAALNLPQPRALLVQGVKDDSLGHRLGLQSGTIAATVGGHEVKLGGDAILSVQGVSISDDPTHAHQLRLALAALRDGDAVDVEVYRAGQVVKLTANHQV